MAVSREDRLRELRELSGELRVALPGVQILGGFLFTVAFTERFSKLSDSETFAYFLAFVSSVVATVLLIAPSVAHRVLWRQPKKERLLRAANGCLLVSSVFLSVATGASAYLVASLTYGGLAASLLVASVAILAAWLWYGLPLYQRLTLPADPD
jgi:hypothetical protein